MSEDPEAAADKTKAADQKVADKEKALADQKAAQAKADQEAADAKAEAEKHPTTENITVLSGTVALGDGDTFDEPKMQALPVGGFAAVPANMHHFFMAKTAATIQVHGMGPFGITYVNAKDDPRTKSN